MYRDPDKPDRGTVKTVTVMDGTDLSVTFLNDDVSKANLAGACLTLLSTGDFLMNNGINRDSTGAGEQEFQSWFVQPGLGYTFERADKTK